MQKEFTENASHELQTPLAVFQSKLDILLQDRFLNENQAALLQSLYEASGRLTRLNKNLLVLAKLDADIFLETERIDVSQVLELCWGNISEQANDRNISCTLNAVQPLVINASKAVIEILLNNLLSNAVRHNNDGGIIKIITSEKSLQITNTGNTSPLPADKLFTRFKAAGNQFKGNGLGLAIVAAIVRKYKWQVSYEHTGDTHSFVLQF